MHMLQTVTWRAAVVGRWTALILGTLMILFFLAFFFGEGPPNFFHLTTSERVTFAGIFALFLGLAAAWKWEGWGGVASICGLALLVAVDRRHLAMWAFVVPAMIGAVHLLCWSRLHAGPPPGLAPWHLSRTWIFILLGSLGLFLVLCANEMFGEPPFMTPSLNPPPELATAWYSAAANVHLFIHPDASVAGTVGTEALIGARILNNRSWFGKLMHWRDDYRINGRAGGQLMFMQLNRRGQAMDGWLWLIPPGSNASRPTRFTLRKE
jgi:hypothetical protein